MYIYVCISFFLFLRMLTYASSIITRMISVSHIRFDPERDPL